MPIEPTLLERQRLAFAHLREHAAHAHVAGDGLLANLLCHTGLDRASRLADAQRLLLTKAELAWMPIFALHWLVNPRERSIVASILKKLPQPDPEDVAIGDWLANYAYLIENPFTSDANLFQRLIALPWPTFFANRSTEAETLLTHLIELAWFRAPGEGRWEKVAEAWEKSGPSWATESIQALRRRLVTQTGLTAPAKSYPMFTESSVEELRHQSDFAELWLLHLYGRWDKVCTTVELLTPNVSGDSHQWRILGDFAHMDDRDTTRDESGPVHFARRRRLSVDTPLLIFHDNRQQRIENLLGEIFRAQSEENAYQRWEVFTLAMLHELSALRLWDFWMWLDAIGAQSEGLLESMQWTEEHPELAAHALVLAVRGMASRDPDKDRITRRVIDVLEFAPAEVLAQLAEGLLATYPLQKHGAAKLLDDITDLLPPAVWPELARWTMSYADESAEWRSAGQQYAPAGHWLWALLEAPPESPVWTTLHPEMLRIASISNCWFRSETRGLIHRWFTRAPLSLARAVGETMIAVPETEARACAARTELLVLLEEQRQGLRGVFTNRLLASALSIGDGLRLARHLALPDLLQREEALRELIAVQIREAIGRAAVPPPEVIQLQIGIPRDVVLVKEWRIQDKPLLEALVAAVNAPTVHATYIPALLDAITLLVANGPVEFAQFVQPHVASWTHESPRGRPIRDMHGDPFSIIHIGGPAAGNIALSLGWLVFQLPIKLGPAIHGDLLAWAKAVLLVGYAEPLGLVVYASMVIAFSSPLERADEEALPCGEMALLSLWTKTGNEPSAAQSLADALHYLAALFDAEDSAFVDWSSQSVRSELERAIGLFERYLPHFARSPRSVVRSAVAELLCQLARRQSLPPALSEVAANLARDNRARVRFEAQGGWRQLSLGGERHQAGL